MREHALDRSPDEQQRIECLVPCDKGIVLLQIFIRYDNTAFEKAAFGQVSVEAVLVKPSGSLFTWSVRPSMIGVYAFSIIFSMFSIWSDLTSVSAFAAPACSCRTLARIVRMRVSQEAAIAAPSSSAI